VIADIPGIIEGAAEGKGLGHYFLRHIERNSTLLFLVPADADDIKKEYDILLDELRRYNPEMLDKDRLIVISKSDMLDDELKAEMKVELDKSFKGIPYMFISSVANQGLTALIPSNPKIATDYKNKIPSSDGIFYFLLFFYFLQLGEFFLQERVFFPQ
jgi:GTP-binding protein